MGQLSTFWIMEGRKNHQNGLKSKEQTQG